MSKVERNCAFEGVVESTEMGREMEGGGRVFQAEATTVGYMLLTTTHQTVDTDDDLREALLRKQSYGGWKSSDCLLFISDSSRAPEDGDITLGSSWGKPSRTAKGVDGWRGPPS